MPIVEYFCPNGSEEQSPACVGLQVLNSAAWIADLWPGGVPAPLAPIVAGLNLGSILAPDLCKLTPLDPGPFDGSWLSPWNIAYDVGLIEEWLFKTAIWFAWHNCCQCKTPPNASEYQFASINTNPWGVGTEQIYLGLLPGNGPWTVRLKGTINRNSGVGSPITGTLVANVYALSATGNNDCNGYTGAGVDLAQNLCSSTNIATCPTWGTLESPTAVSVSGGTPTCLRLKFSGGNATNILQSVGQVYVENLGPAVYPVSVIPGPMPYQGPTGGTTTTPTFPAPTTTGTSCEWSSRAAAAITDFIAPNGRVLLGTHSVSGAGTLLLPSTCDGYTTLLTAIPAEHSRDAGDPPQYYQVGWTVPSHDGVQFEGPVRHVTAVEQQYWGLNTLDGYLIYNLYPGYVATVDFYSAGLPL